MQILNRKEPMGEGGRRKGRGKEEMGGSEASLPAPQNPQEWPQNPSAQITPPLRLHDPQNSGIPPQNTSCDLKAFSGTPNPLL